MAVIPAEIRATLKLYFDAKIRQWYSRSDGKGVIFLVEATSEDEARTLMETLPLAKELLDRSRVHSRRALDAIEGTDGPRGNQIMRDGDKNSQTSKDFDIKERTPFNSGFAAGDDKSVRNSTNQESPKVTYFTISLYSP